MKRWVVTSALVLYTAVGFANCGHVQDMSNEAIEARLTAPGLGQVATFKRVAAVSDLPMTAEDVYNNHCVVCHGVGVAGAPKMGDADAWTPRLKQGMDTLLEHVVNGFGVMPAKGTCMTCSDDDLKAAIEYMSK